MIPARIFLERFAPSDQTCHWGPLSIIPNGLTAEAIRKRRPW